MIWRSTRARSWASPACWAPACSELARAIYGADRAQTTLKVDGKEVKIKAPIDSMNLGMGLLPDDRKAEGHHRRSVRAGRIILALQAKRGMRAPVPAKQEEIADYIDLLRSKTASRETPIKQLSGGNQQKVILARWLATDPDFLILDEPTRGIGISVPRLEIQKLVIQLRKRERASFSSPLRSRKCCAPATVWRFCATVKRWASWTAS